MFGFRLCQALSGMGPVARHPKYLMEIFSPDEWEDWRAFYNLNPFGTDVITTMIAKVWLFYIEGHRSEDSTEIKLTDLLPGRDANSRWDEIMELAEERRAEIQEEKAEKRRMAKMTQEEIDREAKERWIAEFNARQGRS